MKTLMKLFKVLGLILFINTVLAPNSKAMQQKTIAATITHLSNIPAESIRLILTQYLNSAANAHELTQRYFTLKLTNEILKKTAEQILVEAFIHLGLEYPLHEAAAENLVPVINWLIHNTPNLNINAFNDDGLTAIHVAAENNHPKAILALAYAGANPNIKDEIFDDTPLFNAILGDCINAVRVLTTIPGIDINAQSSTEQTPLHCAAEQNNIRAINLLTLVPEIRFDMQDMDGQTPFQIASKKGYLRAARALARAERALAN